jgi:hypothetical protein
MYVVQHRGYGQFDDYGEQLPVAPMIAATQPQQSTGQAVGLVLAFFSTLMFFASIMAQGDRK